MSEPELAQMAYERGDGESSHVVWIGHQRIKDWDLLKVVLERDRTLVARDASACGIERLLERAKR
jgi:hypothetical protein